MSKIPASGLETLDYKQPNWNFVLNRDFELVNEAIKKLTALENGQGSAFPASIDYSDPVALNGSFLIYNRETSQWETLRSEIIETQWVWGGAPGKGVIQTRGIITKIPEDFE